ncbi:unnamed protein product [Thlaspi arvense]|uniref:Homeobox domain-containing protein n=1 Tax=Thlaspi arvense TaxID=13288 RepID=A0AAU9ST45_THLAR|nr:unnamed protein product [Thlaspi arvense]
MDGLLQPKHLILAVKGLHWRGSLEIHKLLKDNEDFCICYNSGEEGEPPKKVNVEKMVAMLPLHLITGLMTPDRDDKFQYVLCGIRMLHTFCDLTSRHPKLEQVLFDDVKLSGQMIELVMFVMIVLGGNRKGSWKTDNDSLIEATLVASSLYLLHGFISPNYQDLVQVLLIHPKADVFIDAAFGAVHNAVRSLRAKLLYRRTDQPNKLGASSVGAVNIHCQQAEAALQFLHCLCQHKPFRERVAKNKELCGVGGVLMLAQTILSLTVTPEFVGAAVTIASISRMKAKVLSILHHLFEAESVSFLDEVASAGNLDLAKTIASEVLELLRLGISKASKASAPPAYPMGFVLLNAMRLADVLTDDSNFRPFFTQHFVSIEYTSDSAKAACTMVLSALFCLSHREFLSVLCSSDLSSREDDATLDYDLFTSTGWVLSVFSSQVVEPQFKLNFQNNLSVSSYAHQRTSLLIKIIANLHCFVPDLCQEEERNRFVHNFVSGLRKDPSSVLGNLLPGPSYIPVAQRGTGVCKNLVSLLRHADSLIPNVLSDEDLTLFRVFCEQLKALIHTEFEESQAEDIEGAGGSPSGNQQRTEPLNLNNNEEASENSDVRVEGAATKQGANEETEVAERLKESDADANNPETSGSDTSSNRGKSLVGPLEVKESVQSLSNRFEESTSLEVKEDERAEAEASLVLEKERKKRKRSILNEEQVVMIENAIADEPYFQRNPVWIRRWADNLSQIGSEVITSSQLKNWVNNRKAKLARAVKQGPVRDNNSSGDLAESPGDENTWQQKTSTPTQDQGTSGNPKAGENPMRSSSSSEEGLKRGQHVVLMDERGDGIGKAMVLQTEGEWHGISLETRQVCVLNVTELSAAIDWTKMIIPYGSNDVGKTFKEANSRFGAVRVAWDVSKVRYLNQTQLH